MEQERKEGGSGPAKKPEEVYPGDQLDVREWETVANVIPRFLDSDWGKSATII